MVNGSNEPKHTKLQHLGRFFDGVAGLCGADVQGPVHGPQRDVEGQEQPGRVLRLRQQEDRVFSGHPPVPGVRNVGPGIVHIPCSSLETFSRCNKSTGCEANSSSCIFSVSL